MSGACRSAVRLPGPFAAGIPIPGFHRTPALCIVLSQVLVPIDVFVLCWRKNTIHATGCQFGIGCPAICIDSQDLLHHGLSKGRGRASGDWISPKDLPSMHVASLEQVCYPAAWPGPRTMGWPCDHEGRRRMKITAVKLTPVSTRRETGSRSPHVIVQLRHRRGPGGPGRDVGPGPRQL